MGFSAAAIEALDYDFSTYPGAAEQPWAISGTVPEPTAARRDAFLAEMSGILDLGAGTPEQRMQTASSIPVEKQQEITAALRAGTARLCNGSPSAEVLDALPARLLDAFTEWLRGELFAIRPTLPPVASSGSPAIAGNGASPTPSAPVSA